MLNFLFNAGYSTFQITAAVSFFLWEASGTPLWYTHPSKSFWTWEKPPAVEPQSSPPAPCWERSCHKHMILFCLLAQQYTYKSFPNITSNPPISSSDLLYISIIFQIFNILKVILLLHNSWILQQNSSNFIISYINLSTHNLVSKDKFCRKSLVIKLLLFLWIHRKMDIR